tara:strand:- start:284 stop:532 length:249 start_codon:yes stop_codon:yes gene_type:complete
MLHLAANQCHGIGAEGITALGLVTLHRIHQPKATLLKKVVITNTAAPSEARGLMAHQIEVGFDETVAEFETTALAVTAMQGQ